MHTCMHPAHNSALDDSKAVVSDSLCTKKQGEGSDEPVLAYVDITDEISTPQEKCGEKKLSVCATSPRVFSGLNLSVSQPYVWYICRCVLNRRSEWVGYTWMYTLLQSGAKAFWRSGLRPSPFEALGLLRGPLAFTRWM